MNKPISRKRGLTTSEKLELFSIPEPTTGCVLWLGSYSRGPRLSYPSVRHKGRMCRAHRVAWELANGEELGDRHALHSCDNTSCVNPAHIRPGTNKENVADRDARGRQRSLGGERHWCAKLTLEQVKTIRSSPLSGGELSKIFGIDRNHLNRIKNRGNWRESTEAIRALKEKPSNG